MNKQVREKEMAGLLGVCVRTLRNWKRDKVLPYTKIGRVVMYNPAKVEAAIARFERQAAA